MSESKGYDYLLQQSSRKRKLEAFQESKLKLSLKAEKLKTKLQKLESAIEQAQDESRAVEIVTHILEDSSTGFIVEGGIKTEIQEMAQTLASLNILVIQEDLQLNWEMHRVHGRHDWDVWDGEDSHDNVGVFWKNKRLRNVSDVYIDRSVDYDAYPEDSHDTGKRAIGLFSKEWIVLVIHASQWEKIISKRQSHT